MSGVTSLNQVKRGSVCYTLQPQHVNYDAECWDWWCKFLMNIQLPLVLSPYTVLLAESSQCDHYSPPLPSFLCAPNNKNSTPDVLHGAVHVYFWLFLALFPRPERNVRVPERQVPALRGSPHPLFIRVGPAHPAPRLPRVRGGALAVPPVEELVRRQHRAALVFAGVAGVECGLLLGLSERVARSAGG